ncbi:hypothetical protein [Paraburkholderia solisilvae]|uniref:Uncharacterized protein n=1 Tax=Paraburkholderia solisilvae TaxID=624376 RepID=A0A6J5E734_9BURK|nr:hypothetical protein [Paraburkholderia solisilvae]CAB3761156.1 hypothetical protein LMG29739_03563 [Paraburkholderia solisilvae]
MPVTGISSDTARLPDDVNAGGYGFHVVGARYGIGVGASPQCPVCFGELLPIADDAGRLFRHLVAQDEARCPLSTPSYQPDAPSVARKRDAVLEREQRGAFIENWQRHFQVMRRAVPSLTVRRFTYLIGYADVMNLWSYPALEQHDLPYVLLTLAQFMRAGAMGGRPVWVRFCFDATVRDIGDLWTQRGSRARLFKMMYNAPRETPFPTSRQLIHYETVRRDPSFLETPPPWMKRADVKEFQRFAAAGRPPADAGRADTGTS